MARNKNRQPHIEVSSRQTLSARRFWRRVEVRGVQVGGAILLLAGAGWFFLPARTSVEPMPPKLESADIASADPAILAVVGDARQAVLQEPRSAARWGEYGRVLAAHTFDVKAAECFRVASELDPENVGWAYLHARCIAASAPDESLRLLAQCAELPADPLDTPRLYLVDQLLELHRLEDAEKLLNASLEKNSANPRARFALARLSLLREDYVACRDQIVATQQQIQESYEAALAAAEQLKFDGRHADADALRRSADEQLRASSCKQKTIGNMLATTLLRLGDIEASRRQQQLASDLPDVSWPDPFTRGTSGLKTGLRAMLSKADVAHAEQRYQQALAILTNAVAQYPDSAAARTHLAREHIRLGRITQGRGESAAAVAHYASADLQLKSALAIDPNSIESYFRRGVLALYWSSIDRTVERLAESEQHFRKATELKPDFAMAYFNLARCLDAQRRLPEAIEAMRESLNFQPNDLAARRGLGGLLMKSGRLLEAISELEQVLRTSPQDQKAVRWLEIMRRDLAQQKARSAGAE